MSKGKIIATDVEITVGKEQMKVVLSVNEKGNLEVNFTEEQMKKMPNGFCYEGFEEELIITPYNP